MIDFAGATARQRAIAALVLAAVWVPFLIKAFRRLGSSGGNDFTILHAAGVRLLAGESIYDGTFMYPPFFAFLMVPLALLPVTVAGVLWAVAKVPLFYLAVRCLVGRDFWPQVLAPVLVYRFLDSDLATGNANVYLLVALALAVAASRRPIWSGSWVAVASAVKLAPAYLLLALGASGKKTTALAGAGVLAGLLLLPSLAVPGGYSAAVEGFFRTSESVFSSDPVADAGAGSGYVPGQSLRAIVHRWTRPIDATAHDRGKHVTINFVTWSPSAAERLYRYLAAALLVVGLFACRGREPRWVFAWALTLALICSPYSRKAHFVLLLPAWCHLLQCYRQRRSVGLAALLITGWSLAQLTAPALWGRSRAAWFLAHGVIGWSALITLVALWLTRPERSCDAVDPPVPDPDLRLVGEP